MTDDRRKGVRGLANRTRDAAARLAAIAALAGLGGCDVDHWTRAYWLINPRGALSSADLHAWLVDTGATFLVIGPTTLLVMWAIWRYRRATGKGGYTPGFTHSVPLEAFFWGFPLVIVIAMGFFALRSALAVDPGDPKLAALAKGKKPVDIDVVTTDWQWLFIYPDRHIAAANELVVPVGTPIRFRLTSATVVADFFIPQLVGQIDIMPGMRTWQSMIVDRVGDYQGFSSDYTGPGFAWMRFVTHVVTPDAFAAWEAQAARSPHQLDQAAFERFATPTINKDLHTEEFSSVADGLFDHVLMNVMMGATYPTPPDMTEKKSHENDGGRQPTRAATPS